MKRTALALAAVALTSAWPLAQAHEVTYNVVQKYLEPDTAPKNTWFIGSFDFDEHTGMVSNLKGKLSESMTGTTDYPGDDMTWITLSYQLSSVYDAALGGWLITTFKNSTTPTFSTTYGGDGWSPASGVANFAWYYGAPGGTNPENAYAMIFVPKDDPTKALTQGQIDKLAYADCNPGAMMMRVMCMTGTTEAGYGAVGSMGGYPVMQTITAVPEPQTYAMLLAGLGLLAGVVRRRGVKA